MTFAKLLSGLYECQTPRRPVCGATFRHADIRDIRRRSRCSETSKKRLIHQHFESLQLQAGFFNLRSQRIWAFQVMEDIPSHAAFYRKLGKTMVPSRMMRSSQTTSCNISSYANLRDSGC